MTAAERQAIDEYDQRQTLLEPFRRVTDAWSVETTHKFQRRIREIDLVASGDLESDWTVRVLARDTGVVVAEFGFDSSGRYQDMRTVRKSDKIHGDAFESWIKSKIEQGQIQYSTLARRLGVGLTDPRVIHDLSWRMARTSHFNRKRRKWYNTGKEASIDVLYDQLAEVMQGIVAKGVKQAAVSPPS